MRGGLLCHFVDLLARERLGENARKGAAEYDFAVLTQKLINVIETERREASVCAE